MVDKFLIDNDIYPNCSGFHYVIFAVEHIKNAIKNNKHVPITTVLYPYISAAFNCKATSVERAIRYVTEKITADSIKEIGFNRKPSNGELLYSLAYRELNQ